MLPKSRRIPRKIFGNLFSKGKRYNSKNFIVYVYPTQKPTDRSIFSFSVSKKVQKSATDRNFLRRRGYSAISKHLSIIKDGNMFLFVYKPKYSKDFSEIEKDILELLSSISVII